MVRTDREMVQFGGGSGYCISAVTSGTRCTNHRPPNLLVLVFEYKCASLVSRCHGSVPHELWFGLINHTNAEPLIVSGVFFINFFIVFRVSELNLQVWECVFFLSFIVVLNLSRSLAILQFIRPEWLLNIIFQFRFFGGLSARRLWIGNSDVYFGLWCSFWHWDTSFWLFTVFPYHSLSTNAW